MKKDRKSLHEAGQPRNDSEAETVAPRLPKELVKRMRVYSAKNNVTMQEIIERGLYLYFEGIEKGETG